LLRAFNKLFRRKQFHFINIIITSIFYYAFALMVLEFVVVKFAHMSINFPSWKLSKPDAMEELVVEPLESSVEPKDWISCNSCENRLFADVRSSDKRALLREFSVSDNVSALLVMPDTEAVDEPAPAIFISGGGGGGPCICCMIPARILCALSVSPDESASSREFKSVSSGLTPDAGELPEDDSRFDSISDKILDALVVSPEDRADCKSLNSPDSEPLPVMPLIVVSFEAPAISGGGGGGPCMCCMIPERMLCALSVSPDESASSS